MFVLLLVAIVGQLEKHNKTGCFASLSSGAISGGRAYSRCEIRFGSGNRCAGEATPKPLIYKQ
jgi:hypothetical protein